jgi:putative ABC transport system ATP-binding protein
MPVLLETRDLRKHYQMGAATVRALDGVSIEVQQGEFVGLLGTSGSGKSTLLNLIAGLDRPTSGSLRVFDQDLAAMTSAAQNVALAMMFAGTPRDAREARASSLLDAIGLGGRQQHRPKELSGGEQQRVAIARALSNDPHLLLADEPTGNLDSRTTKEIMALLKTLNERDGKTIIMVTHDPALAREYAHRTITMLDGAVLA